VGNQCPSCHSDNPESVKFCGQCGRPLPPSKSGPSAATETLPFPLRELPRGTVFARRYEVIEELGHGAMGKVYRVFDREIGEEVALKLVRPEIAIDREAIDRFRGELKLTRKISHRYVSRMYDLGEDQGTYYITMEYVRGEDLKSFLHQSRRLSLGTALSIARQVAEGLEEAHRLGVVHRDLKPANIMIDKEGGAKIMDFGIALCISGKDAHETRMVGTPLYMSPEQVEGRGVDQRSDLYALGAVLYEMVTGKVPFEGQTTVSIVRKHALERPRPPREVNPAVPESLDRLIMKCLEKTPELRYPNASELIRDLDSAQKDLARETGAGGRPGWNFVFRALRSRVLRAAALGLGLVAVAAFGFLLLRHKPVGAGPPGSSPPGPPPVSMARRIVAVLPFDLSSSEPRFANLGRDLAESIRTRLSISGLTVLSPYSSESIQRSKNRPAETAKANVGRYLEGSLRIDKDTVRISVSFVEAAGESIFWAREYVEKLDGIDSEVPDKISTDIAQEMKSPLDPAQLEPLRKRGTSNLDAYVAVVNGRDAVARYRNSGREADYFEALRLIQEGLSLDPGYSLAYRALGDLYEARLVADEQNSVAETTTRTDLEAMIAAFTRANEIDPSIPGVHAGLGWGEFHQGKFDEAYKAFKTALSYDPADEAANLDAGSFLRSIGLDERALRHYDLVSRVDPFLAEVYHLSAVCEMNLGNYAQAEARLGQALALEPESVVLRARRVQLLILMGRTAEADAELKAVEALKNLSKTIETSLAYRRALILAVTGQRDRALSLLRDSKEAYRPDVTNAYCALGMKAEAIRNIKWGNENGFQLIKDYLYPYPYLLTDPFLKVLNGEAAFRSIVLKEKAAFESKLAKYGDL
jgi:serine/threonine protein kinase/tetratricopeptide (TPR) repeat protein